MYLELNGNTVTLDEANGYLVRQFGIGYPRPRQVVDDRPNADGTDDRTEYFGAKVVSLDVTMQGNKWDKIDELGPFLIPSARPYLYYDDATQPRRIRLRPMDRQLSVVAPTSSQQVMLQWAAPDGVSETATQSVATVLASAEADAGFTFDLSFNIVFPSTSPVGTTVVTTVGNAKCYPVIQLWGPCTNPRIENIDDLDDDGNAKELAFSITLASDEYLEVDIRDRTVLFNGPSSSNVPRYNTLDFATAQWWTLQAGQNRIRYFPQSYSGAARAVLSYRCTFI